MPITTSEIISQGERNGRTRLVYRHVDNLGIVYGPWVEERPTGSDFSGWLAGNAISLAAQLAEAEMAANAGENP